MRRIIIESPLAGDLERNQRYARWCMLDSLRRGEAPFASHLTYTQCLDDERPEERELGTKAGFSWAKGRARVYYVDLCEDTSAARTAQRLESDKLGASISLLRAAFLAAGPAIVLLSPWWFLAVPPIVVACFLRMRRRAHVDDLMGIELSPGMQRAWDESPGELRWLRGEMAQAFERGESPGSTRGAVT